MRYFETNQVYSFQRHVLNNDGTETDAADMTVVPEKTVEMCEICIFSMVKDWNLALTHKLIIICHETVPFLM